MLDSLDLPNRPDPFDKDSGGEFPFEPVFKLTKEIQFFLIYSFAFLFILYFSRAFFDDEGLMVLGNMLISIDDLFMIFVFSLGSLYIVSFFFKYIIVKMNLSPNIQYGHLRTKQPLEFFNMSLVYVECCISYKDNSLFAGDDKYIDIIEKELYSNEIYFSTNNQTIPFDSQFKEIENYKCQTKEINLAYKDLIRNYDSYNLEKIISKEELEALVKEKNLKDYHGFCIELHYIENKEDNNKDVVVSNTNFFDNFEFDSKTLWSIFIGVAAISFGLYDEVFINTEQTYTTLLFKSIQYNIFFYAILFLIQKKYLYR